MEVLVSKNLTHQVVQPTNKNHNQPTKSLKREGEGGL